jgi:hypothetical protein
MSAKSEDAHMQVSGDPRVGTELAGYRVESLLGQGGMSVVYLAEDLRLKRRVALKLMAAGLAEDDAFRERFLRESELAASIDHPSIIPIYEAGERDGTLFIGCATSRAGDLRAHAASPRREEAGGLHPKPPAARGSETPPWLPAGDGSTCNTLVAPLKHAERNPTSSGPRIRSPSMLLRRGTVASVTRAVMAGLARACNSAEMAPAAGSSL